MYVCLPYVSKGVPCFLSFLAEINNSITITTVSKLAEFLLLGSPRVTAVMKQIKKT